MLRLILLDNMFCFCLLLLLLLKNGKHSCLTLRLLEQFNLGHLEQFFF